jgi:DNA-binding NarL/FixJ family response regulator
MITILVVDDHPMVAEALVQLVESTTDLASVGIAATASDAVRLAVEAHPDVVVMDYHLPDASGAVAAAAIRASGVTATFLFFSADESDEAVLEAAEAGASGYLGKGLAPPLVLDAIRSVAAGDMLVPPALLSRLIELKRTTARAVAELAHARDLFTDREIEILGLMRAGLDNAAIAERLAVELSTTKWHVANILGKLDAHSKLQAVAHAADLGLLEG